MSEVLGKRKWVGGKIKGGGEVYMCGGKKVRGKKKEKKNWGKGN